MGVFKREVAVQRKIQGIEDKIQELKLQRKILIDELENGRIKGDF
jgi:hypothetical protein